MTRLILAVLIVLALAAGGTRVRVGAFTFDDFTVVWVRWR